MLVKTATLDADNKKSTRSTSALINYLNELFYRTPSVHQPTPEFQTFLKNKQFHHHSYNQTWTFQAMLVKTTTLDSHDNKSTRNKVPRSITVQEFI